jgi:hypothetical protein
MPFRPLPAAAALLLAALAWPQMGEAQATFGVEGRAGVTYPVGDFADARYEGGLSLGVEGFYHLRRALALYASVSRHTFSCDGDCVFGEDPQSSGVGAGIKLMIPSPADALLWVRGGLLGFEYSDAAQSGDRSIGFEVGLGMDTLLTESIYLTPHMGYLSHEAIGGLDASFLTFGFGVQYRFQR